MEKNQEFRPNIKPAVLIIQLCLVSAGIFAQQMPEQYLTAAILENYIANEEVIGSAFEDLHYQDEKIQKQYGKYIQNLELFFDSLSLVIDGAMYTEESPKNTENYDIAKAYRKVLRIYVPQEAKTIYLENGLGEQGHQAFMCLVLGIMAVALEQEITDPDLLSNKTRKALSVMVSLINPQDLALITEHFERLW